MAIERWPALRYEDGKETLQTLHLWTQIAGKIRLRLAPFVNHWWHVALYVTPAGLTTSAMPYHDGRTFAIDFDFCRHELRIGASDGETAAFALEPMTVAGFYERVMRELHAMRFEVPIGKKPNEVIEAIPFDRDTIHAAYDRACVERFFGALREADRLCKVFRSNFLGKASPVHFFWGSFDLAESRFSGRRAPPHPGGFPNLPDWATREAYSHEEHSCGFWTGSEGMEAAFYAYAYPEPAGFAEAQIAPATASWNPALREFVLPYDAVRASSDPDGDVLDFFNSTYAAAADLAHWDREALDRV